MRAFNCSFQLVFVGLADGPILLLVSLADAENINFTPLLAALDANFGLLLKGIARRGNADQFLPIAPASNSSSQAFRFGCRMATR
jgi:hypothetical protein